MIGGRIIYEFIISRDIHGTLDISKIVKFFNEH